MAYIASLPKAFNQIARNTVQLTEANRPPKPPAPLDSWGSDDYINPISGNKATYTIDARDVIYQSLIADDIDLFNPRLNVRDAYIRHVEQQNADLKDQITDMQDHLVQADRVILGLLAALMVLAFIAVMLVV